MDAETVQWGTPETPTHNYFFQLIVNQQQAITVGLLSFQKKTSWSWSWRGTGKGLFLIWIVNNYAKKCCLFPILEVRAKQFM